MRVWYWIVDNSKGRWIECACETVSSQGLTSSSLGFSSGIPAVSTNRLKNLGKNRSGMQRGGKERPKSILLIE